MSARVRFVGRCWRTLSSASVSAQAGSDGSWRAASMLVREVRSTWGAAPLSGASRRSACSSSRSERPAGRPVVDEQGGPGEREPAQGVEPRRDGVERHQPSPPGLEEAGGERLAVRRVPALSAASASVMAVVGGRSRGPAGEHSSAACLPPGGRRPVAGQVGDDAPRRQAVRLVHRHVVDLRDERRPSQGLVSARSSPPGTAARRGVQRQGRPPVVASSVGTASATGQQRARSAPWPA